MIYTMILSLLMGFSTDTQAIEPTLKAHEIHISKCLIDYNTVDAALQLQIHVYMDDLETMLKQYGDERLNMCTEKEHEKTDEYVFRYLQDRVLIKDGADVLPMNFIGKEADEEMMGVWCYVEIPYAKMPEQLNVTFGVLTDLYDDQNNIVSVTVDDKQKDYFLARRGKESRDVKF